jgi:hypothetical protein
LERKTLCSQLRVEDFLQIAFFASKSRSCYSVDGCFVILIPVICVLSLLWKECRLKGYGNLMNRCSLMKEDCHKYWLISFKTFYFLLQSRINRVDNTTTLRICFVIISWCNNCCELQLIFFYLDICISLLITWSLFFNKFL